MVFRSQEDFSILPYMKCLILARLGQTVVANNGHFSGLAHTKTCDLSLVSQFDAGYGGQRGVGGGDGWPTLQHHSGT